MAQSDGTPVVPNALTVLQESVGYIDLVPPTGKDITVKISTNGVIITSWPFLLREFLNKECRIFGYMPDKTLFGPVNGTLRMLASNTANQFYIQVKDA